MKNQKRNERNEVNIRIDKDLNELKIFVRDLIQNPFDFLREMMHLIIVIIENTISLPQIY